MKLKVKITGPKVYGVGYRPYLTELAMRMAFRGFEVYNDDEDAGQAVIALVEGDEQRVRKLCNCIMMERPQLSIVDNVKSEDYSGDIYATNFRQVQADVRAIKERLGML